MENQKRIYLSLGSNLGDRAANLERAIDALGGIGVHVLQRSSIYETEPVDFLIGNTYGKYLERDTGVPLIRLGFPIFDRHHHHRFPIWGYEGGLRVLVMLLDEFFEALDANTNVASKTDYSFDIIR